MGTIPVFKLLKLVFYPSNTQRKFSPCRKNPHHWLQQRQLIANMEILFSLLYPALGLVSRAGMNEALLFALEPRINIFLMKKAQNVEHVIHIYHWFTCILHPKAACLCLQRLGCVLQSCLSYLWQSDTILNCWSGL